jgi:hypothetical protein
MILGSWLNPILMSVIILDSLGSWVFPTGVVVLG